MALSEVESACAKDAPLDIDRLTSDDIAGGLALSTAAGWNQTADDWNFFIEHGHSVGCRDPSGRLVATAAALPYGSDLGWISMVLVAAEARHRGHATALLGDCIETLRAAGRTAVLDATPAGFEVYRRVGFVAGFTFERWQGNGGATDAADAFDEATNGVVEGAADDASTIAALDTAASGIERSALMRAFVARPSTRVWLTSKRTGFAVARAGARATQIGPVVAATQSDAVALLETALNAVRGRVLVDVPEHVGAVAGVLADRAFTRQRPFTRMAQGAGADVLAKHERVHALAGPEFG